VEILETGLGSERTSATVRFKSVVPSGESWPRVNAEKVWASLGKRHVKAEELEGEDPIGCMATKEV
jgi:hypothetical protein